MDSKRKASSSQERNPKKGKKSDDPDNSGEYELEAPPLLAPTIEKSDATTKIILPRKVVKEVPAEIHIPSGVWCTGAPLLWKQKINGSIDYTHPDLKGRVVLRRDYTQAGEADPTKFHPHGTHVAGTIAATGEQLIFGVAPGAELVDYRVFRNDGSGGHNSWITAAVRQSIVDKCNIVSMSLGGPDDYPPMHEAIKEAVKNGILVVVAVGNEGARTINYPGYYPEVVGVAAVNFSQEGKIVFEKFSSTNEEVDVAADGSNVLSTIPGNKYDIYSGTSMATPHVSGIAALLISKAKSLRVPVTESNVFHQLKMMAIDVGREGVDINTGYGFVTFYPQIPTLTPGGTWELEEMNVRPPYFED